MLIENVISITALDEIDFAIDEPQIVDLADSNEMYKKMISLMNGYSIEWRFPVPHFPPHHPLTVAFHEVFGGIVLAAGFVGALTLPDVELSEQSSAEIRAAMDGERTPRSDNISENPDNITLIETLQTESNTKTTLNSQTLKTEFQNDE